jgi:protoporphyrinogen oxidase
VTTSSQETGRVVIIGGGITGLSAAYELAKAGCPVTVVEAENALGGLAGSFEIGEAGTCAGLERFYHHWFKSDVHILGLIDDIGQSDRVVFRETRTGLYYANSFYRLSNPFDVLRFTALQPLDRLRLGWLALRVKGVKDWRALETKTAKEWLLELAGPDVYRVVWEPLLIGKFGPWADKISAVWFWNKIALRGGSRGKGGAEMLAYYSGGFGELINALRAKVSALGGEFVMGQPVSAIEVAGGRATGVRVGDSTILAEAVLATPALPIIADLLSPHISADAAASLRRIQYLGNVCLVLELDRSLSKTYWLNVNDPSFPFVGIIEHTNFEPTSSYSGRHIAYLSKYLPTSDALYVMTADQLLAFATPHLQRMFPAFEPTWVRKAHVWRAEYAQPIVERNYSALIPPEETGLANVRICSMAQIYPEDRGTNYAVREGRRIGRTMVEQMTGSRR